MAENKVWNVGRYLSCSVVTVFALNSILRSNESLQNRKRGGLMVSEMDSGSSGPGLSPGYIKDRMQSMLHSDCHARGFSLIRKQFPLTVKKRS